MTNEVQVFIVMEQNRTKGGLLWFSLLPEAINIFQDTELSFEYHHIPDVITGAVLSFLGYHSFMGRATDTLKKPADVVHREKARGAD